MPNAGEPKGFGEIGVPIMIGDKRVEPGDWAIGDDSGVVIVPKARAAEIANRAMDVFRAREPAAERDPEFAFARGSGESSRWEKK